MNQIFKLTKPVMVDGKEVSELPYNFEDMTARDRLNASKEMAAGGFAPSTVAEFDSVQHLYLFAAGVDKATGGKICAMDIMRISARDSKRAGDVARHFFYLSNGLEAESLDS